MTPASWVEAAHRRIGETMPASGGPAKRVKAQHKPTESWAAVLRLLQTEPLLRDLFRGDPFVVQGYASRSEAEMALVMGLMRRGATPEQCNDVLMTAGIGKWPESAHYREQTLAKALQLIHEDKGSTSKGATP